MSDTYSIDTNAFHEFEHGGWERAAEHYADSFGGVTTEMAPHLLNATGVTAGSRVLDVACGPGFIAGAAMARGANVIGLDFSAAMIALARARYPAIELREGDAEALPFDAAAFDVVVMNFGLLHLAHPEQAIAEANRVLRRGGRYAFTIWAAPKQAVGFGIVLDALAAFGRLDVGLPEGPPFFRFSETEESQTALRSAGFTDIECRTVPLTWRVTSADEVFDAMSRGGVRTSAVLRAQTPEVLERIQSAVRQEIAKYARDGAFELPMPAVMASGTRAA